MSLLLVFCLVCSAIYCSASWILSRLLAWLSNRRFRVKLQIGRISIPKFELKDVNISKNGYSIHIDKVAFRSSLVNSDVKKVLTIIARNVRINNHDEKQLTSVANHLKLLLKQNSTLSKIGAPTSNEDQQIYQETINYHSQNISQNKALDFTEAKLPPGIVTFAQFMSVSIRNLFVTLLHGNEDGSNGSWLLDGSTDALHVEGATAVAEGSTIRSFVISLEARDIYAKLVSRDSQACLAEVATCISVEASLLLQEPLNIEKLQCTVTNPTVTINEELYSFLQRNQQEIPQMKASKPKLVKSDIFSRLLPIIPKNFNIKIENTSIWGIRKNHHTKFNLTLHNLQLTARFSAKHPQQLAEADMKNKNRLLLPQVYVAFQMDQLKLNSNVEKLLYLHTLKLDASMENGILNLFLFLNVLSLMCNHEDIYSWYHTHFQSKQKAEIETLYTKQQQQKTPDWSEELFSAIIVQGCAEMCGITLSGKTSNNLEFSTLTLGCTFFKIKLDQLLDTREILIDSGWISTVPSDVHFTEYAINDASHKKLHSWGTALYIGEALVKWDSHNSHISKVQAMLDCIRFEWSPCVGNTILAAIKCLHDYAPIKQSDLDISEKSTFKLLFDVSVSNINTFFFNNDNICFMNRVDTIKIDNLDKKTFIVLSNFMLADIVPNKAGFHCQKADEMLDSFCHLKLTGIELLLTAEGEFQEINVNLLESVSIHLYDDLELKWCSILNYVKTFEGNFNELLKTLKLDPPIQSEEYSNQIDFHLLIKGESKITVTNSEQESVVVSVDMLFYTVCRNGFSLTLNQLKIIHYNAETIHVGFFSIVGEIANHWLEKIHHFLLNLGTIWFIKQGFACTVVIRNVRLQGFGSGRLPGQKALL